MDVLNTWRSSICKAHELDKGAEIRLTAHVTSDDEEPTHYIDRRREGVFDVHDIVQSRARDYRR